MILIFAPPFKGHLNVLKGLGKIVTTGWTNIPNSDLARSELHGTDPRKFTLPRVKELLPDCIEIAKELKPTLIIYDFFSLEGYYVGKKLNIPTVCSIPAMIGSSKDIELEGRTYESISDGIHIPAENNIVWSYPEVTPKDFMKGRKGNYHFVGNPTKKLDNKRTQIYISLGTVVMNNLWNNQEEVREGLKRFIGRLAELWKDEKVVFVTQGKEVLKKYPEKWRMIEQANQVEELSKSKLFVTHGGSNGFHEAYIQQTPMAVIPFFGDQILVAQQVEKLGLGINLVQDKDISTEKDKSFLDEKLAEKLASQSHFSLALLNLSSYSRNRSSLSSRNA